MRRGDGEGREDRERKTKSRERAAGATRHLQLLLPRVLRTREVRHHCVDARRVRVRGGTSAGVPRCRTDPRSRRVQLHARRQRRPLQHLARVALNALLLIDTRRRTARVKTCSASQRRITTRRDMVIRGRGQTQIKPSHTNARQPPHSFTHQLPRHRFTHSQADGLTGSQIHR
jgi:hypothetical protein